LNHSRDEGEVKGDAIGRRRRIKSNAMRENRCHRFNEDEGDELASDTIAPFDSPYPKVYSVSCAGFVVLASASLQGDENDAIEVEIRDDRK
jgi:hypothetical protein